MNAILTQINKDREEFEKDFDQKMFGTFHWKHFEKHRDECLNCTLILESKKLAEEDTTTSHLHAMQATLKMILEKKKEIDIELPDTLHRNIGYNQALEAIATDIREVIKVLEKEHK